MDNDKPKRVRFLFLIILLALLAIISIILWPEPTVPPPVLTEEVRPEPSLLPTLTLTATMPEATPTEVITTEEPEKKPTEVVPTFTPTATLTPTPEPEPESDLNLAVVIDPLHIRCDLGWRSTICGYYAPGEVVEILSCDYVLDFRMLAGWGATTDGWINTRHTSPDYCGLLETDQ